MINTDAKSTMNSTVQTAINGLIGISCCRQRLGIKRSLSLGFGNKIPHDNSRLADSYYGEWEIGTYSAAWRVVYNGNVLCGSQDIIDSTLELEEQFRQIQLGRISGVYLASKFDVRVEFDDGKKIDFLGASSDDDEMFHIFCPNGLYVKYSTFIGWEIIKHGRLD